MLVEWEHASVLHRLCRLRVAKSLQRGAVQVLRRVLRAWIPSFRMRARGRHCASLCRQSVGVACLALWRQHTVATGERDLEFDTLTVGARATHPGPSSLRTTFV